MSNGMMPFNGNFFGEGDELFNVSELVTLSSSILGVLQGVSQGGGVVVEDNLNSDSSVAALSARMGKELAETLSEISLELNRIAEEVQNNKVVVEDSLDSDSSLNALSARQGKQLAGKLVRATGTVTLTNTLEYPFNDSLATIIFPTPFAASKYYLVAYEILSATVDGITYAGRVANNFVSDVCISDKLLNGCNIEYSGAATSVTVEYVIAEAV